MRFPRRLDGRSPWGVAYRVLEEKGLRRCDARKVIRRCRGNCRLAVRAIGWTRHLVGHFAALDSGRVSVGKTGAWQLLDACWRVPEKSRLSDRRAVMERLLADAGVQVPDGQLVANDRDFLALMAVAEAWVLQLENSSFVRS